jgi:predicted secreted protein
MRFGSLFILGLLMQLAVIPSVRAGDAAELEILGFSQDGGVFAFEEYGVQDGSGFPYSNRYYVDTKTDKFLPGTPIRIRLDDETATLDAARQKAREGGEKIISHDDLAANRGFTAGLNRVTELSADPFRMAVNPRPVFPPIDPSVEFRLEQIPLAGADICASQGDINGFRLLRIDATHGGQTRLLHEDKSIPQSRGCPFGYLIGGVQTLSSLEGLISYAVLIAVRQHGFEGPDHRWIAVTGRF